MQYQCEQSSIFVLFHFFLFQNMRKTPKTTLGSLRNKIKHLVSQWTQGCSDFSSFCGRCHEARGNRFGLHQLGTPLQGSRDAGSAQGRRTELSPQGPSDHQLNLIVEARQEGPGSRQFARRLKKEAEGFAFLAALWRSLSQSHKRPQVYDLTRRCLHSEYANR